MQPPLEWAATIDLIQECQMRSYTHGKGWTAAILYGRYNNSLKPGVLSLR